MVQNVFFGFFSNTTKTAPTAETENRKITKAVFLRLKHHDCEVLLKHLCKQVQLQRCFSMLAVTEATYFSIKSLLTLIFPSWLAGTEVELNMMVSTILLLCIAYSCIMFTLDYKAQVY